MVNSGEQTTPQPAAPDWLTIARDAFVGSTNYFDNSIRFDIEQDIRQFQSVHPAGSKYLTDTFRARSHFFRPKTRSAIRKGEATAAEALFATEDVLSVAAEDDENPVQQALSRGDDGDPAISPHQDHPVVSAGRGVLP